LFWANESIEIIGCTVCGKVIFWEIAKTVIKNVTDLTELAQPVFSIKTI
jgi:hypothetical protein